MRIKRVFLSALLFIFYISVFSQNIDKTPISKLAVKGYDVVSYFTDSSAAEGNKKYEINYLGAVWRFVSAEHLELFKNSPEKYAPQYGGYCAWAVGHNYTAGADPICWKIVDGKLYLNYNKEVQNDWSKDIPNLIEGGNKNWEELRKK